MFVNGVREKIGKCTFCTLLFLQPSHFKVIKIISSNTSISKKLGMNGTKYSLLRLLPFLYGQVIQDIDTYVLLTNTKAYFNSISCSPHNVF